MLRKYLRILIDQLKSCCKLTSKRNSTNIFPKLKEITAVDLIERFHTILQTISCKYEVHSNNFKSNTMDTVKLFTTIYRLYT